jgi:hypothetical protein
MQIPVAEQKASIQPKRSKWKYGRFRDERENLKANETRARASNSPPRPDNLEAVEVCLQWKNRLFVIILSCLILLQASFWFVKTSHVEIDGDAPSAASTDQPQVKRISNPVVFQPGRRSSSEVEMSAKVLANLGQLSFEVSFRHLATAIRAVNSILVITSVLYSLTMLLGLTVSLLDAHGGTRHISQAFYLSLIMLVLLMPWQSADGTKTLGTIYTPSELLTSCLTHTAGTYEASLFYLHFTGYSAVVLAILGTTQIFSMLWSKARLRKLERAACSFWYQVVAKPPGILYE